MATALKKTEPKLPPDNDPEMQLWYTRARSALAVSDTKANKNLGRRRLGDLLYHLAQGIPLQTAAPLVGVEPSTVWRWGETKQAIGIAIKQARAHGQLRLLNKIADAPQWQAAQYLLSIGDEAYSLQRDAAAPTISINVNVPVPQPLEPGEKAKIINAIPEKSE